MERKKYLEDPDVAAFINWFARRLGDRSMRHEYINRQSRRRITLNGLCGALAQYYWKDKSYDENECDLRNLRSGFYVL